MGPAQVVVASRTRSPARGPGRSLRDSAKKASLFVASAGLPVSSFYGNQKSRSSVITKLLAKRPALRPEALFGRLRVSGGLRFEPMTAVYPTPIKLKARRVSLEVNEVHLGLESLA